MDVLLFAQNLFLHILFLLKQYHIFVNPYVFPPLQKYFMYGLPLIFHSIYFNIYIVKHYYKYFLYLFFWIYMLLYIHRRNIIMKLSIQNKLKEKNMTRYELAKKIGVTYPTIDKIYKGESTSIKFDILESICKELDCSPIEILDSDDTQMKRLLAYANEFYKLNNKDDTH
nr:MAG TPA: Cro/C1-type HTH DNA-binding domain protein [Caudoviricetes sp.]